MAYLGRGAFLCFELEKSQKIVPVSCRACDSSEWPLGLSISTSGAMGERVALGESVSIATASPGDRLHLSDGCRYRSKSKPGMS